MMDVKPSFFNDFINEEVHVSQPLALKIMRNSIINLYNFKNADRFWYEGLTKFSTKKDFLVVK